MGSIGGWRIPIYEFTWTISNVSTVSRTTQLNTRREVSISKHRGDGALSTEVRYFIDPVADKDLLARQNVEGMAIYDFNES